MPKPDVADSLWRRRMRVRAVVLGVIAAGCWVKVFMQPEWNGWWLLMVPGWYCTVVSLYLAKLLYRTSLRPDRSG